MDTNQVSVSSFVEYADTVHRLIRFAEVREHFNSHVNRWRCEKSLIQANKVKAEEDLSQWLERTKADSINTPDWQRRNQAPPELLRRVEEHISLSGSLLSRLTRMPFEDLTSSEKFTLLAQIHDVCHTTSQLGPTDVLEKERYLFHVGVVQTEIVLEYEYDGRFRNYRSLTNTEEMKLGEVLEFVLARIEHEFEPTTEDDNGETLKDVVGRFRMKWNLETFDADTNAAAEIKRLRETDYAKQLAEKEAAKAFGADDGKRGVAAKTVREQRGMTIDQRMKLVLFEKPESSGWSVTEFETELNCSRGGIHKTASWKALEAARKLGKAERRKDRRAKTR